LEVYVDQGRLNDDALSVHLHFIGVSPDQRQQGRGARLMQIVLAAADAVGLPVTLEVSPEQVRGEKKPPMNKKQLRAFYEKFGFRTDRARGLDAMVRDVPPRKNPRRR
jgi:ribosomal protein S18 acetylase RimI-like enzyme